MSETEDELWGVIDQAIFATSDPDQMVAKFKRAYENRTAKQSTFGGYLGCLRTDRHATASEMALKAGLNRSIWQSWEADRTIPTPAQLHDVCRKLELGDLATEQLLQLRAKMPRTILARLSHYEPDQLVASGTGLVEAELEWHKLPPQVQDPLTRWAQKTGHKFPQDLFRVLFELETRQDQQRWVDEVLNQADVE